MKSYVSLIALFGVVACATDAGPVVAQTVVAQNAENTFIQYSDQCISEQEVVEAQIAWGNGIIKIGNEYSAGGDYVAAASDHINEFYGYDLSLVLFKPTLASVDQFRASFDGALSYFVGGNPSYPEDKGFALQPWTQVRWENAGITNNSCTQAIAMGNYYFTPQSGEAETKVEYTIGYIKDVEGDLRMVVHQSSLPYNGG
jgi:hypothetical protein